MKKTIWKWIIGCSACLAILVAFSCSVPLTKGVAKQVTTEGTGTEQQMQNSSPQDTSIQTPSTQVDIVDDVTDEDKAQLNIEIPEGLDGSDITILNDYLTQTVKVCFSQGIANYVQEYRVHGSSNHIASVTYYMDGASGVLEIGLDTVCELTYTYQENYLCIEFIEPHEIYDKIIVIDAGHGGKAVGAVRDGVCEKDLNLAIVKEIYALMKEMNDKSIKVYYTRLGDTNPTLSQRVGLANKVKADLFISIHNNTASESGFTSRNGTLVLYNAQDDSTLSSKRFAEICLENVNRIAGSNRRGIASGDYVQIVKNSQVPVALIEVGYMTNAEEFAKLQTPEYRKLVAQGVYSAIVQAFEEGY